MSGGRIVKEGFLTKSPPQDKLMANWQKRFFVLWSTRLMEYYSSAEKRPQDYRKTIDLNNCEDMVAPLPVHSRQFVIKLLVKNGVKMRDYYFECSSESEMDNWVNCLAQVCGFSAIEETNITSPFCPPVDDQSAVSPHSGDKPRLRPPLPPPKPLSPASSPSHDAEEVFYEDPQVICNQIPSRFEDSIEEVYDNFSETNAIRALNMCPPPIWKQGDSLEPPPLPPSHPSRRYTRVFDAGSEIDEWRKGRSPKPSRSSEERSPKNNKKQFGSMRDLHRVKVKGKPPAPPSKPRKCGSSDDLLNTHSSEQVVGSVGGMGRGMGFNLKNDPKFGKKLNQRRQEIYGETDKSRPKSWGHEQEEYEEVAFTASDDDILSGGERRGGGERSTDESDEGYVDCELHNSEDEYLEHDIAKERSREKGSDTLKRDEFLKRPPLPLPSHTSAGKLIKPPPKLPVGSRALVGPPTSAPRPFASSPGSDAPPPIPRRGNERPPLPLPGEENGFEGEDDAPPVPRRHPHASDKNRAHGSRDHSTPPPPRGSPPDNPIPLPPRSLSPTSPARGMTSEPVPPVPNRGTKPASPTKSSGLNKAPPPIPRHKSPSPEGTSSPHSANSDHVFEDFTFGLNHLPMPTGKPQPHDNRKAPKAKLNPPLPPSKNQVPRSKLGSYETRLPPDIGMKPPLLAKKSANYETNLPPSIGNRPTQSLKSADTRAKPPVGRPPVAAKPALPKSPPHVSVKPTPAARKPLPHPKPAVSSKPATLPMSRSAGVSSANSAASHSRSHTGGSRTLNSAASTSRSPQPPVGGKPSLRTRNNVASKPPAPPNKPRPILPPTTRKPIPTPGM